MLNIKKISKFFKNQNFGRFSERLFVFAVGGFVFRTSFAAQILFILVFLIIISLDWLINPIK